METCILLDSHISFHGSLPEQAHVCKSQCEIQLSGRLSFPLLHGYSYSLGTNRPYASVSGMIPNTVLVIMVSIHFDLDGLQT